MDSSDFAQITFSRTYCRRYMCRRQVPFGIVEEPAAAFLVDLVGRSAVPGAAIELVRDDLLAVHHKYSEACHGMTSTGRRGLEQRTSFVWERRAHACTCIVTPPIMSTVSAA